MATSIATEQSAQPRLFPKHRKSLHFNQWDLGFCIFFSHLGIPQKPERNNNNSKNNNHHHHHKHKDKKKGGRRGGRRK